MKAGIDRSRGAEEVLAVAKSYGLVILDALVGASRDLQPEIAIGTDGRVRKLPELGSGHGVLRGVVLALVNVNRRASRPVSLLRHGTPPCQKYERQVRQNRGDA